MVDASLHDFISYWIRLDSRADAKLLVDGL